MRYLILSFIILISNISFAQNNVELKFFTQSYLPDSKNVTVKCEITKPKYLTSYAVFRLILPPGITVKEIHNDLADFEIRNNVARYTWFRLAAENDLYLNFELVCNDASIKKYEIYGDFMYMTNNKKGIIKTDTLKIDFSNKKIQKSPEKQAETKPAENQYFSGEIFCDRYLTKTNNDGEYKVTLKLQNNKIDNFKIFEILPSGFTFKSTANKYFTVTKNNNIAEFYVKNISQMNFFEIEYFVINKNSDQKPLISGQLVYISDNKTLRKIVKDKN